MANEGRISTKHMESEEEQAHRRDMANLRKWRGILTAIYDVLDDPSIHLGPSQRNLLIAAQEVSEARAEHIEAVWN